MAADDALHVNDGGLALNALEWLETHHRCKAVERERMVRDMDIQKGSSVIDAGCGPGLWTALLARAIGPRGRITGVDLSPEALVTARQRSRGAWYRRMVSYRQGLLEALPVEPGSADVIFCANVSQYLPDPAGTFASMGRALKHGGRLVVKDMDCGSMRFRAIDPALQSEVFHARARWERARVGEGYAFEDSWVGGKLTGYLRQAGYAQVQECKYRIVRCYPLEEDFRSYLQGIGEWFGIEGAPFLDPSSRARWLELFQNGEHCALDRRDFLSEETEYVVTAIWLPPAGGSPLMQPQ